MTKKIILLISSFLFLVYPVSGITLTISPENPIAGEEITMQGLASPNEALWPTVSFEKTVSVADGKYSYRLYGIKIPSGENNFAVTAKNPAAPDKKNRGIFVSLAVILLLQVVSEGACLQDN